MMADMFELRFQYNPDVIQAIKTLPPHTRRWDREARCWRVDCEQIYHAATLVENILPELAQELRDGPRYADARDGAQGARMAREASKATDADLDIPSPEGLSYMPFQRAGIAYAMGRKGVLIGDEMGLGKTIQAIGVINSDENIQKVLVVCPASLRLNWKRELERWLVRPLRVGIAQGKDWPLNVDIVVVNYDVLKNFKKKLYGDEWDLLVVDECHYLKNPKAQRTVSVFGKWNKDPDKVKPAIEAKRRVFLTGTPIVNRPIELWPLLQSLDPDGLGSNWRWYVTRYCDGHQTKWGWDVSGASRLDELQDRLRTTLMVRRLKSQVLQELPAKRRQVLELPANGADKVVKAEQEAWAEVEERLEELRAAVELAKADDDEEKYKRAVEELAQGERVAFTEMARLRHETALAKVPAVLEQLQDLEHKVVVFGHHKDVIDAIMAEIGDRAVKLTGETPMEERQEAVDRFQTDSNVQFFVGNIQAAGVGITLTAASHVVFAELDWVPGNMSQAEDRCHRIGQQDSVFVQHLVLEGSLDATMAKTLIAKQSVIDKALDEETEQPEYEPVQGSPAVTKTVRRSQLDAEAANFTDEMVAAVHEALQRLAGVCDGARLEDGCGFNRVDTRIGKDLASREKLTRKQAALGRKIVRKYHRQIGEELIEAMKTNKEEKS
jgi:SWI/SNF-related matrix-associated actin-dependent regulator 1 of chromatin subfamily A